MLGISRAPAAASSPACATERRAQRFALNLFIAFLPAAILGLLFNRAIKAVLFAPVPVALAFVVGAFVILWVERRQRVRAVQRAHRRRRRPALDRRAEDRLRAGVRADSRARRARARRSSAACCSACRARPPPSSRSSSRSRRCSPRAPTSSCKNRALLVVAGPRRRSASASPRRSSSAFLCVRWLLRYVSHHDFVPFAWYRIAFGVADPVHRLAWPRPLGLSRPRAARAVDGRAAGSARCAPSPACSASRSRRSWSSSPTRAAPVDATTLLTLRMIYSAPLFGVDGVVGGPPAGRAHASTRRDWLALAGLGFIGYYLASLLDFIGLQYITASLERLILFVYPTIVVVLSAAVPAPADHARARSARSRCATPASALAFVHDLQRRRRHARARSSAACSCSPARSPTPSTSSPPGAVDRAPRLAALRRVGDARVHGIHLRALRADAPAVARSTCRRASTRCRSRWRCSRRCCRPG